MKLPTIIVHWCSWNRISNKYKSTEHININILGSTAQFYNLFLLFLRIDLSRIINMFKGFKMIKHAFMPTQIQLEPLELQ